MAKNKDISTDIPSDPVERLNKLLDKHYPGALKNKIQSKGDNIIVEINDIEINRATELFRKAQEKFTIYLYELEDRIVFPKKEADEILRFIRNAIKLSAAPKPTLLPAFKEDRQQTESRERQSSYDIPENRTSNLAQSQISEQEREQREREENLRALNEYANVPREQLHIEPELTPQRIAKEITKELTPLEGSLQHYIHTELRNPSHGHLGGLVGSDQFVKKGIAENILGKLETFNTMSITDPDYQKTKRNLKNDLHEAIEANRKAHGFWASLGGPGRLEEILLAAEKTLEMGEPDKSKKRRI